MRLIKKLIKTICCVFILGALAFVMLFVWYTHGLRDLNDARDIPKAFMRFVNIDFTEDADASEAAVAGDERIVNILVSGMDTENDPVCVFSLNRDNGKWKVLAFDKDIYIPLPEYGKGSLADAYSFGGMELVEEALSDEFDIPISQYIEVDLGRLFQTTAILAPLHLDLTEADAAVLNEAFSTDIYYEGENYIEKEQYLALAQSNGRDGNETADRRLRMLLSAAEELGRSGIVKTAMVTRDIWTCFSGSLEFDDYWSLFQDAGRDVTNIKDAVLRLPAEGDAEEDTINGRNALIPNTTASRLSARYFLGYDA